jgi:addiction module RelE/StbE family toxin
VKKIIWRRIAERDRDRIFDRIAKENPRAAIELDMQFEENAALALQRPNLYKPGRVRDTREIVTRPNYVMVYRADVSGITILRVLHARRKWPLEE